MALSNWDTVAWDREGKPCVGRLGAVEIHKDWVYLHIGDKSIEIQSGVVCFDGLTIVASRGEYQESVFVAVKTGYEDSSPMLFGIGCYGFHGEEWVGVQQGVVNEFKAWLETVQDDLYLDKLPNFEDGLRYNQGDAYFANVFDADIPGTQIGKAEKPILITSLENDGDAETERQPTQ